MDTAAFWHMIERAKAESNGDCDQQAQLLEQWLAQLSPGEIQRFDQIVSQFMWQSFNDHLWAAAFIINGGCSDDGFMDFRGWLIAQGEAIFYAALQDPDSLAEIVDADRDDYECEALLYVAMGAYEARTGTEMPQEKSPSADLAIKSWEAEALSGKESPWENGDLKEQYAQKHFPKLCAKFEW